MSAFRGSYNRKRRSDDECSSNDSDEDLPPVKRSCLVNREPSTLPKYLLYVKDAFARRFSCFVNWISAFPENYIRDKESMLKSGLDGIVPIEIEEEDDLDVIEISSEEDSDLIIEEDFNRSSRSSRRESLLRNSKSIPVSSSTPVYRGENGTRGRTLNSLSRRPVNGYNNSKTYATRSKKDSTVLQKLTYSRNVAPITNPSLDVEILLDTREIPNDDSDDLEIVSEISTRRSSRRLALQTISPVISKIGHTSKGFNGTSPSDILNGKGAFCEKQITSNKTFTADQVIRLKEKQEYKMLLDRMIGNAMYGPVTPKKVTRPTEIQIDLTGDHQPHISSHFKREGLMKDVSNFLQRYYKPCDTFTHCASPKGDSEVEVFIEDDDVKVIEDKESNDYFKYKPKFDKGSDVSSSEWIENFKTAVTLRTKDYVQSIAKQEEKIQRYQKRRADVILKEKILRGQSISSDQSEKDEFPELTPDMDDRIEWAFDISQQTAGVLAVIKDCTVTSGDLITLSGLNWLNDSVINFYLALVVERNKKHPEYPSVFAFNSYFYTALKSRGPKGVMRWTRKFEKNIFQFDILIVPLHLGMHWALCVVDNRVKKIKYYDSMQGTDDQCLRILQNYLIIEKNEKLGILMDPNEYSMEIVKDIPQQMNGSDCGMFTVKYAEYISRDAPITFSQEHMQYFRRRMVIEILDKKLF